MRLRSFLFAGAACIALSGCASFATSPDDVVRPNVKAAVEDVKIVDRGAVAIATEMAKALLSSVAPLESIAATLGGL